MSYAQMLEEMPTDDQIREWRRQAAKASKSDEDVARWGEGIVWSEFHMSGSAAIGWF